MTKNKSYLTLEKKLEFEAELNNLKNVKRQEISKSIEWAKSLGDLSENAEYQTARQEQAKCEDRIQEIEYILQNSIVLAEHIKNEEGISIGSIVLVKRLSDNKKETFNIVGTEEVDIKEGKISNESPIGLSLIGKNKGDKIKVNTPKGIVEFDILSVE